MPTSVPCESVEIDQNPHPAFPGRRTSPEVTRGKRKHDAPASCLAGAGRRRLSGGLGRPRGADPSACGDGGARHGGVRESAEEDDVQGEPAPYWAAPRTGLRPSSLCGAALPAFASINKSGVVPGAATAAEPGAAYCPRRPCCRLVLRAGAWPCSDPVPTRLSSGTVGAVGLLK